MESASERMPKRHEAIIRFVLDKRIDRIVPSGVWSSAAAKYKCSAKTVRRVFKNRDKPKKKITGRPRKYTAVQIDTMLRSVPVNQRATLRSTSSAIGIPNSALHRHLAWNSGIQRVSVSLKSYLTPDNMNERLRFSLTLVDTKPRSTELRFDAMYDRVFVDEMWFHICKSRTRYYLGRSEKKNHRTAKNKNFVTKVVFLCAVARPRYCHSTKTWFDGKLGLWPFVEMQPAKRTSKYRVRGTMKMRSVNVSASVYKESIINKVIPSIKQKWPGLLWWLTYWVYNFYDVFVVGASRSILIQQDNASAHGVNLARAVQAFNSDGNWNIRLDYQPPNSPDLDILDLASLTAFNPSNSRNKQTALRA